MKTLSIQQPWAELILHYGKNIENRSWPTAFRGEFLIHTGKKVDADGFGFAKYVLGIKLPKDLPTGGIVGKARLIDCIAASPSKWFFGPYGFVLDDVQELEFQPYPGRLRFFDFPYDHCICLRSDRTGTIEIDGNKECCNICGRPQVEDFSVKL